MKAKVLAVVLILSGFFVITNKSYAWPLRPVADVKADPEHVLVNGSVSLDGSGSYDPDGGPIIEYCWDFTNDDVYDECGSNSSITTPLYTNSGTYTVKLKVKDNEDQTDTATCLVYVHDAKTWYVDQSATSGGDNGSDWANAFIRLQDALDVAVAQPTNKIWVAKGTYYPDVNSNNVPDGSDDRSETFELLDYLEVYGGFPTGGGNWESRDPKAFETILSGDLQNDDGPDFTNRDDNSYHVVTGADNAILDGFTITGGNANGSSPDNLGGGIYCNGVSPTISNCVIIDNSTSYVGGGMCNYNGSSPTVTNCFFINNKGADGAGMGNYDYSHPTLTNCVFSGNYATHDGGGIRNISYSSVTLINCTFSKNHAEDIGGGLDDGSAYSPMTNCIFWGNTASYGSVQLQQIAGLPVVNYSCIQDDEDDENIPFGGAANGNTDDDPLFAGVPVAYWKMDDSAANPYVTGLNGMPTELVPNPRFEGSSNWIFGGNWFYSAGAYHNGDGDEALQPTPSIPIEIGKKYAVYFELSHFTSGSVAFQLGGVNGTERTSTGPYIEYITATSTQNLEFWAVTTFVGRIRNIFCFCLDAFPNTGIFRDTAGDPYTNAHSVAGKINTALNFDGTDDYIDVGDPVDGSLDFGTSTDFTISAWFKTSSVNEQMIVNKKASETTAPGYEIYMDNAGKIHSHIADGSLSVSESTTQTFNDGINWHHLVVVYDRDDVMTIYVDGLNKASESISGILDVDTGQAFTIGARNEAAYFNGSIDEVMIFDRTLSAEEIEQLYQNEFSVDDYHLLRDSPCVNGGDPGGSYDGQTDIDGESRVMGAIADMGADEVEIGIIYVDVAASSGGNGLSWATAYDSLQLVLSGATAGEEVWVKADTYKPTTGADQSISFNLKSGVAVYGGFAGDEISRDERDWKNNYTILSGDLNGDDGPNFTNRSDNSYHVVIGADDAVLDGFIIMGGYANGTGIDSYGGGMLNDLASPTVRNCRFLGNYAQYGGGVYNKSCIPQIINCIFSGNNGNNQGGGMYNNQANPSIVNCTFSLNQATNEGGGMYNYDSSPAIINCIIWGNWPATGNSIHNVGSSEPYISYSDVEDCYDGSVWDVSFGKNGGNNIDEDPLFDDDLGLQPDSPCIDEGIGDEDMGSNEPVDGTSDITPAAVTNPVDLAVDSVGGNLYVLDSSLSSPSQVFVYDDQLVQQGSAISIDAADPKGIALDGDDNIYITDTGGNRILKYTNAGTFIGAYAQGQFNQPYSVAVDYNGNIYVTDSGDNTVKVFDSDWTLVAEWGELGDGDGQLNNPSGFCLFGSSEMFLADTSHNRIQRLSAQSGYFLSKVGEPGSQSGQFNNPRDVCYDIDYDQIIVADTDNDRIQIFQLNNFGWFSSNEMTYLDQINAISNLDPATLDSPGAVACAPGQASQVIYIADTGHNRVVKVEVQQEEPGRTSLHTFEMFKAALQTDDVDKALTFFAEASRENYAEIFQVIELYLQDYVDGMGEMTLASRKAGKAKYEMLHDDNGQIYSFPVFFIKDEDGNWRIFNF